MPPDGHRRRSGRTRGPCTSGWRETPRWFEYGRCWDRAAEPDVLTRTRHVEESQRVWAKIPTFGVNVERSPDLSETMQRRPRNAHTPKRRTTTPHNAKRPAADLSASGVNWWVGLVWRKPTSSPCGTLFVTILSFARDRSGCSAATCRVRDSFGGGKTIATGYETCMLRLTPMASWAVNLAVVFPGLRNFDKPVNRLRERATDVRWLRSPT
jgi:hypothetical protein